MSVQSNLLETASEIAALNDILTQRGAVDILSIPDVRSGHVGVPIASVPEGRTLQDVTPLLNQYLPRPLRREGMATLLTEAAFHAHVERFRSTQHTVLFADPTPAAPSLTAVFDYHQAGAVEDVSPLTSAGARTGWGKHRARLALRMSDEWKAWLAVHGKDMDQGAFAAFLQDRIGDLILVDSATDQKVSDVLDQLQARYGSPQQVMQLSRGIQVRANIAVKNAVTLEDGSCRLSYAEEHTSENGAPLTVPTLFFITIPVFYAGEAYRIAVRVRYRMVGPAIVWSLHLYRHDRVFEDAFGQVIAATRTATSLDVLLGSPES